MRSRKKSYELSLGRTYYEKGFFNLGVDVSDLVQPEDGMAILEIAASGRRFEVRLDRKANPATDVPRVFGGVTLRNWIQSSHRLGDIVSIEIAAPGLLRWHRTDNESSAKQSLPDSAVTARPDSSPDGETAPTRENSVAQEDLARVGFVVVGSWLLDEGRLSLNLEKHRDAERALYAFVSEGVVLYIGKTSRLLRQRLYFYSRPGKSQSTNIRANKLILDLLNAGNAVDIHAFIDSGSVMHRGIRVNLAAGLEDELITLIRPPWNIAGL